MMTIYHISEVGPIGYGCRHMSNNDVHLLMDSVAAITRSRSLPFDEGQQIDSLAFTTLLPFAPRFLINTEMDDTGEISEVANCGCVFGRLGMNTVIRNVASFGKLTGQGMTLYGVDILKILEHAMPERFGGCPGDYQLVENDTGVQTEMELRVSPRAGQDNLDLGLVREYFLEQLKHYYGGRVAARVWNHASAICAVRKEPIATYTGKVLPLALAGAKNRRNNS